VELTALEGSDPRFKGEAPAPSHRSWHIKGFAQSGYGVLAKLLFVQRLAGDDHSGAFGRALTASR
jgi:hypothetical protein